MSLRHWERSQVLHPGETTQRKPSPRLAAELPDALRRFHPTAVVASSPIPTRVRCSLKISLILVRNKQNLFSGLSPIKYILCFGSVSCLSPVVVYVNNLGLSFVWLDRALRWCLGSSWCLGLWHCLSHQASLGFDILHWMVATRQQSFDTWTNWLYDIFFVSFSHGNPRFNILSNPITTLRLAGSGTRRTKCWMQRLVNTLVGILHWLPPVGVLTRCPVTCVGSSISSRGAWSIAVS